MMVMLLSFEIRINNPKSSDFAVGALKLGLDWNVQPTSNPPPAIVETFKNVLLVKCCLGTIPLTQSCSDYFKIFVNFSFQTSFCLPIGRLRMRLPVAAKIALVIAGTIGEVAGSPVPVGAESLLTMLTLISGVSLMRAMR